MLYQQYKKQAIADLKNYHELKGSIKNLSQRIKFLQNADLYTGTGYGSKVMASRDGDSSMVRHISHIEEMEKQLHYTKLYVANMENALALISPKEKDILTAFYINRQRRSVNKLAEETFSDRSWLYRRAQKALEHYIEIYFGITKESCS